MNTAIPQAFQKDILEFVQSLSGALGEELDFIVLYAAGSKGKAIKETDNINLMIVVREIRTEVLNRIGDPYLKQKRAQQLQLLTLSEEDLRSSTDVFPIKFLNMQQDYEVLAGSDCVAELSTGQVWRQENEILSAGEELGLNIAPVRRIRQLRNGKIFNDPTDQQTTCEEFMTTV